MDSYDNFVTSDRDHTPFNLVDQEQEDLRGTRYVLGLMTFFQKILLVTQNMFIKCFFVRKDKKYTTL